MDVMVENAAGLDVHKDSVVACVLSGPPSGPIDRETRSFGTTTRELLRLRDWLEERRVEVVVMEATGVYWRPVFNVLQDGESGLSLVLANAHRIKNVPGRKSDVMDAEWIAQLGRHGLVSPSFVPPRPIRELRDLVRYRKKLVVTLGAERNRIQKVLEDANIKLGSVVTDILGQSSRAMLEGLRDGHTDSVALAAHARGKLRKKEGALAHALEGRPTPAHRYLLAAILRHVDFLQGAIENVENEIDARLAEDQHVVQRLATIPGVSTTVASGIIAELGTDMTVFPSSAHVASWAGVAPGSRESAGKKKTARVLKGRVWLKTLLCEAAWGAVRTKDSYLAAKYHKLKARRGPQRALIAIAHKILVAAYQILKTGRTYQELGGDYLDRLHSDRRKAGLIRALQALGYDVELKPRPGPTPNLGTA